MHGGRTARRLEHPQNTPERGPTIEALAHQAHVSAAWLGEEFRNGQAPAVSPAGFIQRRSRHPPVSGGTKHPNAGSACSRFLEAPRRHERIILRARTAAIAHVLSLTFLSNVVAYVCRTHEQSIGMLLSISIDPRATRWPERSATHRRLVRGREKTGGKGGKGGKFESLGNSGLSDDGAKWRKAAESGGKFFWGLMAVAKYGGSRKPQKPQKPLQCSPP